MRRLIVSPHLVTDAGSSGQVPVVPNRQAARSLGVPYRSLEGLAARTIEDGGRHIAPQLITRRALFRCVMGMGGSVDALGFSRVVEGTLRELLRAGADVSRLQGHASARVARLARTALAYREVLGKRGLVDPAELLWLAAATPPRPLALCVSGFPRLPAAERQFIDAIAADDSVVHLPVAEGHLFDENRQALDDFLARGWQLDGPAEDLPGVGQRLRKLFLSGELAEAGRAETGRSDTGRSEAGQSEAGRPDASMTGDERRPAVIAYAYPDLDAEVRGALAQVKQLLAAGSEADRIAIVARDEQTYGGALIPVAEEYQVPFRALYQAPLSETRLGTCLDTLLQVVMEDFPFEASARLLAHPLVDALDPADWQDLRRRRASGAEAWQGLAPALAEPWPERAQRGVFVTQLLDLLERLGLRRNAVRWAREALAYQTFTEELRELPEPQHEIEAGDFVSEIAELAGILTVPMAPGRGGVELHTPLSLFGAQVDHLFLLGAAEGILPSPVRPDPLLDPFEREELKGEGHPVETVDAAARREELSFWALLQSARRTLRISYPKLLGRSETLASPYLAMLGLEPEAPAGGTICSLPELRRGQLRGDEVGDHVLALARHSHAVESRRESAAPHDGFDGIVGTPYSPPSFGVGVTRMIDLVNCPFKFFAKSMLRLNEPEEGAVELEASLRGRLYHQALHLSLESARGAADVRQAALEALESSFAAAEEELELDLLATWPLEREQHLATLRGAILGPDFIDEGAQIKELETGFQAHWRGIPVQGRVDRIDSGPSGLSLIDYKSGSSVSNLAKDLSGQATVDLQLPVYREAAPTLAPGERVAKALYYSVTKAKTIRAREASEDELAAIAERIQAAWTAGAYPVEPDVGGSACRYCEFDAVCRKGPRLERKRSRE